MMANSTFPHGSQWKCAGRTPAWWRAKGCVTLHWRKKMFQTRDSKINRRNTACPPVKNKSTAGCDYVRIVRFKLKLKKFRAAIFPAIIFFWGAGKTSACGPFFPNNLLDAGDQAVLQAPVTDFRRELERMKL